MSEMPSRASFETTSQYTAPHLERPLTRSKSIRFAGPAAQPGPAVPITMREATASSQEHESRRRSLQPRVKRHNSSVQGEDGFVTALPSHGDYIETRVASQPSSYRRLRKSKSMFSPGLLSSAPVASAAPDHSRCPPQDTGQHAISRLGRSFSFLRPNTERTPSQAVMPSGARTEAIGLARDQYLRQLEQQRSNKQPGTGHAVIRQRSQKTFRKSVRTGSGNHYGSAVRSPTSLAGLQTERKGIGVRARDLSSTFRNRFKRVFNRSSEEIGALPAQQLRATRPHFGDSTTAYAPSKARNQPDESAENSALDPKDLAMRDGLRVPRRRGSLAESVHTATGELVDDTPQSRVTSWANSTAANTVSSHHASVPKQLSIIPENGGVPSRLRSLHQLDVGPRTQPRKSSLYAKLQQRIAKSNSTLPPDVDADDTVDGLFTTAELDSASHGAMSEARSDHDHLSSLESVRHTRAFGGSTQQHVPPLESVDVAGADAPREVSVSTSPKRPLRETKSTFFPQSMRIERSRTSPYRQAMQSSGCSEEKSGTEVASSPLERVGGASYLSAATRSRDRSLTRSVSIYSRTSSGDTPQPFDSSTFMAQKDDDWDGYVSSIPRKINLVDRLQASAAKTDVARKIGHKREYAEVTGVDTDIGRLHHSPSMLKNSLAGSHRAIDIRPSPSLKLSQPMIDRFPLMSISPQANTNNVEHQASASPRAATRHTQGNENRHPNQVPDKGTENSNVQQPAKGSFLSRNPLPVSTPTSHSRSSPERIARLRRMQSSSIMGSPGFRKDFGPSPKARQRTYAHDEAHESITNRAAKGGSLSDRNILAAESQTMVDSFLSNRGKSGSVSGDETVFI